MLTLLALVEGASSDGDPESGSGQLARARLADSTARAGDERDFVCHQTVERTWPTPPGSVRPESAARRLTRVPIMVEYETLVVRKDDGVAWVSLNRPKVRNAINQKMQDELGEVWT